MSRHGTATNKLARLMRSTTITPVYAPNTRTEMLQFITNTPRRTLEIGCREGDFSRVLKERFCNPETWGIEPDPSIRTDIANANLDHFIPDYFPQCVEKLGNHKFDAIILNDVLEHMYDPWSALDTAHELLDENGVIVVSLPNIRNTKVIRELIFKNDFRYTTSGILDISHIRFFTTKSMLRMFRETGFQILKMQPLEQPVPFHKKLRRIHRYVFNLLTFGFFDSLYHIQYGFTLTKRR